jgi:hypothetical protein
MRLITRTAHPLAAIVIAKLLYSKSFHQVSKVAHRWRIVWCKNVQKKQKNY